MIYDLHSHTSVSDGTLSAPELLQRAIDKGVDALAITDHDTIAAYKELTQAPLNIELITGVEFSTQWENTGIHVLGLNIDLNSDAIKTGTRFQTEARLTRARLISEKLAKKGIENAFEGASTFASKDYIGRPHFAQYLIEIGKVSTMQAAFKKYLGDGKAGDVKQHWAALPQIIDWIRDANGIAVLAHPLKYKLTNSKLKRLLDDFILAGGQGIEVVSGQQLPQQTQYLAHLCEQKKMLASCGSDFHMPDKHWAELGVFPALPHNVTPVWDKF